MARPQNVRPQASKIGGEGIIHAEQGRGKQEAQVVEGSERKHNGGAAASAIGCSAVAAIQCGAAFPQQLPAAGQQQTAAGRVAAG